MDIGKSGVITEWPQKAGSEVSTGATVCEQESVTYRLQDRACLERVCPARPIDWNVPALSIFFMYVITCESLV